MEIRLTTFSENTAEYGFLGELGLSILVEVDGTRILMDAGLNHSAVYNAQLLGTDLSTIDMLVLSHGQTDHTDGLVNVLRVIRKDVELVAHPDVWAPKCTSRDDRRKARYIGIPFMREQLESLGARFDLTKEKVHLTEHTIAIGEISMMSSYEDVEDNLLVKRASFTRIR